MAKSHKSRPKPLSKKSHNKRSKRIEENFRVLKKLES